MILSGPAAAHEVIVNVGQPCSLRYRLDRPDSPWIGLPPLVQGSNRVNLPDQDVILQAWSDQGLTRAVGERRVLMMTNYLDIRLNSGPHFPRILLLGATLVTALALLWKTRVGVQAKRLAVLEELNQTSTVLNEGRVFGSYRILSRLGRGGTATVYRAASLDAPEGSTQVALKLIPCDDVNGLTLERFQRECSVATRLKHPHLVRLLDYGQSQDYLYLALELVEGESLRRCLREDGMEIQQALTWMIEMTEAVNYCHQQCIIHCDLKPENIMVDRQNQLKILDFGLARDVQRTHLTPTGKVLGTPAYLAPERYLTPDEPPTAQVDQYALGVIFFEMLTGRLPMDARQPQALAALHAHQSAPLLNQFRPDAPDWLVEMVLRMLQKSPAARFPSLDKLLVVLQCHTDHDQETQNC